MATADERKLALYNLAIRKIGAKKMTSLTDGSKAQIVLDDIYPYTRDTFLCEAQWTFAKRRFDLVNITEDEDAEDWVTATAYVPGDQVVSGAVTYACLIAHTSGTFATDLTALKWQRCATEDEILFTEDDTSIIYAEPTDLLKLTHVNDKDAVHFRESMLINSVATKVIRANAEGLKIIYTFQNDDLRTYYPPSFEALATKLAADAAFDITENNKKASELLQEYETVRLPRAIASDSQQGSPTEARQDAWETARETGQFVVAGETWHPVN